MEDIEVTSTKKVEKSKKENKNEVQSSVEDVRKFYKLEHFANSKNKNNESNKYGFEQLKDDTYDAYGMSNSFITNYDRLPNFIFGL